MGWKMFGKSKKNGTSNKHAAIAPIEANNTIIKLRDNILLQEKREEHLQIKIDKLTQLAKLQLRKGDKRSAVSTMKKRKLYEAELAKIDNVKLTLETQAISLEGATQNVSTMEAMKRGNGAMVSIRKAMGGGVESVDDMMDEMRDEMDLHQEVNNAFSQPLDPLLGGYDDDELFSELNELSGMATSNRTASTASSSWSSSSIWSSPSSKKNSSKPDAALAPAPISTGTKPTKSSRIALFA